jgi:hypothetical protein
MSSVQSVLLYGAEVWAHVLSKEKYRRRLGSVQRRAALRVASAYRTVSEAAVLVIAGVIPIALQAQERQAIYRRREETDLERIKSEERSRTMDRWQAIWNTESRGRWTRTIIKEITPWLEKTHGEVDYYLTQFLSGHGYFRSYLNKIGKAPTADCVYCKNARDDAEHTFFACEKWQLARQELEGRLGREFTPETVEEMMLADERKWEAVTNYVRNVLLLKKIDLDNDS